MQSWVHDYKQDHTHALAALLTFFVQVLLNMCQNLCHV